MTQQQDMVMAGEILRVPDAWHKSLLFGRCDQLWQFFNRQEHDHIHIGG